MRTVSRWMRALAKHVPMDSHEGYDGLEEQRVHLRVLGDGCSCTRPGKLEWGGKGVL